MTNKRKILVVGQTPPPFHGQAISTQRFLNGKYEHIELYHVRMIFSREIDKVGKFHLQKVWLLIKLILQIYFMRIKYHIPVLYYMPVGYRYVPLLRDVVILTCTRWLFKKTVFHLRVGGLSALYHQLPGILQFLVHKAYFYPDLSIRLSLSDTLDSHFLQPKKEIVVPNGMEDFYATFEKSTIQKQECPVLLYVGAVMEAKGILTLLEVCFFLKQRNFKFSCKIAGKFASKEFEEKVFAYIHHYQLIQCVQFAGVISGELKWKTYAEADIFCFPSHAETFGLVLLEAMQFKLPIVASDVGGIPSIIQDQQSGFLVPVKDSRAFAEKMALLLTHPNLGKEMGEKGRKTYLEKFTVEHYRNNMEKALLKA